MKHIHIDGSLQCLYFRWECSMRAGWGVPVLMGRGLKNSWPHIPQLWKRGNPAPYIPVICGKTCTWQQTLSQALSFKTKSSIEFFFDAQNLVFVCICNGRNFRVMNFWNIYGTYALYLSKCTRCGSMIYFYACSLFASLMHYHYSFLLFMWLHHFHLPTY